MDTKDAAAAFKALAQPTRFAAFRRLVTAGPEGLAAGDLAAALAVPHNTLSTHLAVLRRAGLAKARDAGRTRRYAIDAAGMRALTRFLMADCCGGRPEICAPATALVQPTPFQPTPFQPTPANGERS